MSIVTHKTFQTFISTVVILNTLQLAFDDPTKLNKSSWEKFIEIFFISFYIIEMILKIVGFGFIRYRHSYIRDPWNVLDFLIIVGTLLSIYGVNVTASLNKPIYFSSLKILSPIRTIKSIPKLKNIIKTILASMPVLGEMLVILLLVFGVFALIGLHLFHGTFKQKCMPYDTGRVSSDFDEELMCGGINSCPIGFICAKSVLVNPVSGIFSYDNFLESLLMVYIVTTEEGWSVAEVYSIKSFSWSAIIFYTLLIFIGAYLMLNLALAIVVQKFDEVRSESARHLDPSLRNLNSDRILHKYFPRVVFDENRAGISGGVPLPKMLLLNAEKYARLSKTEEIREGRRYSGFYDLIIRPFYKEKIPYLNAAIEKLMAFSGIKEASHIYWFEKDAFFFSNRDKEFLIKTQRLSASKHPQQRIQTEQVHKAQELTTNQTAYNKVIPVISKNKTKSYSQLNIETKNYTEESGNDKVLDSIPDDHQVQKDTQSAAHENENSPPQKKISQVHLDVKRNKVLPNGAG